MNHLAKISILAVAATLAACTGTANSNRSLDSVHQPVVRNAIFSFDVVAANGELPPSEQGRLQGWLDAMAIRYGDRIAVEDPSLYGSGAAIASVRAMVERRGLLMSDAVPVTSGAIPVGSMRVTITRSSAHVPGCPDWSSKSSVNFNNATSANYGCASNSNLAAMIADPNDLIKGADDRYNDPASSTKPIQTFREKKPTGGGALPTTSTSEGGGQ